MKKGKLFEILEKEYDEEKIKNFIIMNGKRKPYCPISFADVVTEETRQQLISDGYEYLLQIER